MGNIDFDLLSVQEARDLCNRGAIAGEKLSKYKEGQIDAILKSMVDAAKKHAVELAEMAVEDTGFGKVLDKTYKNHTASVLLYDYIKDMKTQGIICEDKEKKMFEVAEPVGLVMGIIPSTNPTSTIIYKSIIAIKSRNAIVFSPHPSAARCSGRAAQIMAEAAERAGAPADVIQWQTMCSMPAANELMHHEKIKLIIATGGPGMVKAAYSAGKPAIGVGAGNSPAYIERTADVAHAVSSIIASKTFDNGTVCASEQSIICEEVNREAVIRELKANNAYFLNSEELKKVCALLFKNGHTMNAKYVGRSAKVIAEGAGILVPDNTTVLIGEQMGVGPDNPLSYEKLTCVLGFYTVKDWHEACELSIKLLQNGIGHTMSLHTMDESIVREFSVKPASRILVNTGSTMGGVGLSTALAPAFTLGCGTWGGSSVSENVTPLHLINKKTVCYGIRDARRVMQDDASFQYALKKGADPVLVSAACSASPASPFISYSVGCDGCQPDAYSPASFARKSSKSLQNAGAARPPEMSEETQIDLDGLKDMIDGLVRAMKGE